ncbi:isoamyl acetate-hydrolyzing esterase 1-like [Scleropages formosus]|uniref:Isoamyl acetate-hydrolyzing esterase 1 homolog n=1 Tax=Scleropages formosus TaxID=113540 RepID=A0A0P7WQ83_SCLFO|nr:isoamyl acetate-hydrolyzing esterase 1-like [Scleropages formosus]
MANGWGSEIANKLARRCDVMNRGFSGYNSRWAKMILPCILDPKCNADGHIAAVTIFFGANDSSLEDVNPQQHVPLQEYMENLKDMVKHLVSVGVPVDRVILVTAPPLYEPAWEKECRLKGSLLNRLNAVTGEYAQACVQVAGQCGIDVLDLWTLMQKDGTDFSSYLSDGLHLSDTGNELVAQHLWTFLEKRTAHLPMILPYWGNVDARDPQSSLLSGSPQDQ